MSADCWRICPQCKIRHKREREGKDRAVMEAYGKVSGPEWLRMQKEEDGDSVPDLAETLREDYEMVIREDGLFYISYSAGCEICGFSHSFEHDEQLKVKATP